MYGSGALTTLCPVNAPVPSSVEGTPVSTVAELYDQRYLSEMKRAALLLGSPTLGEDVVAEAFCDLIGRWESVRDPAAYLSRSVLNGCRRAGRWRRRTQPHPDLDRSLGAHWDQPDELFDTLLQLPFRQRAVVVLRYHEGRTEREIAALLGIRPGSVGPTLRRALDRLRPSLERKDV